MTEQTAEKKKRRSAEEIAAEKRAWLEKHEWRGPIEACATLKACASALEEANMQCSKIAGTGPQFTAIVTAARKLAGEIEAIIPQTKK